MESVMQESAYTWHGLSPVPKGASSNVTERLNTLLAKYPRLWKEGLEAAVGSKGTLTLKESAIPVFCKARPIPYGMWKLVEAELEKLQKDGVISPVTWSEWATPLVVVPKRRREGQIMWRF